MSAPDPEQPLDVDSDLVLAGALGGGANDYPEATEVELGGQFSSDVLEPVLPESESRRLTEGLSTLGSRTT
jgi:hypothetical protein